MESIYGSYGRFTKYRWLMVPCYMVLGFSFLVYWNRDSQNIERFASFLFLVFLAYTLALGLVAFKNRGLFKSLVINDKSILFDDMDSVLFEHIESVKAFPVTGFYPVGYYQSTFLSGIEVKSCGRDFYIFSSISNYQDIYRTLESKV